MSIAFDSSPPYEKKLLYTQRQAAKKAGLPEHFVRMLVSSGKVLSIPAGNRRYVNMKSLYAYINGSQLESKEQEDAENA